MKLFKDDANCTVAGLSLLRPMYYDSPDSEQAYQFDHQVSDSVYAMGGKYLLMYIVEHNNYALLRSVVGVYHVT